MNKCLIINNYFYTHGLKQLFGILEKTKKSSNFSGNSETNVVLNT